MKIETLIPDPMPELRRAISQHLAPPERLSVWQWAERHLQLTARVTPRPGPYRTDFCPYVRAPQEDFTDPEVETIVLCWASRTSKTETMMNCIRYSIACDPQPMLLVFPSTDFGRSFNESRLLPSIQDTPLLKAELPDNTDEIKLDEMHFRRCSAWIVGANSPANLKGRGVAILLGDEIDTWPPQRTKETGALQLALDRTKDRWNRKHLLTSTPTVANGQVWKEFQKGDQRYYFVPCPHCGEKQRLIFAQVKWSEEAKGEDKTWDFQKVRDSAFYECEKCQGRIEDVHKPMMLRGGEWRATNPASDKRRRSYHLNSLYPEWLSFADVAVKFLQSKDTPDDFQDFVNAWLAEPFYGYADQSEQERVILASRIEVPTEKVPEGHIAILTADVQLDSIYYVIRAHNRKRDSVLLDSGHLQGLEDAEVMAKRIGIFCAGVDRRYRAQAVMEWCARHGGWIPMAGAAGMFSAFRWVKIPIDGGAFKGREVRGLNFRPDDFREEWHSRVNKIGEGRPLWNLPATITEDYKKQMMGEVRRERTGPKGRKIIEWHRRWMNHYFDCEMMQLCLFEAVRSFAFQTPDVPPSSMPRQEMRPEDRPRDPNDLFQGEHDLPR